MKEKNYDAIWIAKIVIPILIAILSLTLFSKSFTTAGFTTRYTGYLDDKKTTVMELSAASTAASVALSMVPGDAGTPIAEKLADLSGYSMLILCAIFLEKYLVTIINVAAFKIVIPIACAVYLAGHLIPKKDHFKNNAIKIGKFAIVLFLLIPLSIETSKLIEKTYQDSIEETIQNAKEDADEVQNYAVQDESLWQRFINTIEGGVSGLTKQFENTLNNFLEAIAVLIVTSCIIPILVLVFMVWLVRLTFGLDKRPPIIRPEHFRRV